LRGGEGLRSGDESLELEPDLALSESDPALAGDFLSGLGEGEADFLG